MNEQKPSLIVHPEDVIIDPSRTWGIVQASKVKFSGYKTYRWDEFRQFYEAELLDGKPRFNLRYLKVAKKILDAYGIIFDDCLYHFAPDNPLVIDTQEGWCILIAPQVLKP